MEGCGEFLLKGIAKKMAELTCKKRKKYAYVRVNNNQQRRDLDRQITFFEENFPDHKIITDICIETIHNRKGLNKLIDNIIEGKVEEIIVFNRHILSSYAFDMIKRLVKKYSKGKITVLN